MVLQSDRSNNDLLMKQIMDLFKENDLEFDDISQIFVNQGPGNFSGLRGSLATAKGISLSKNLNLFGYNTFIWSCVKFITKKDSIFSIVKFREKYFIKKFDNDLCNNLINDLNKFISKENLQKINKLSVSIGPANFNASRLIVVLARTISQQINCPLDSFSSFEIMAKRIASKNNIFTNKKSFWIYKKLKRKGFIAGKYEI